MAAERPTVALLNPIGAALAHFTEATSAHLARAGCDVSVWAIDEPSASGDGRLNWIRRWARLLRAADETLAPDAHFLIMWPALGYWDALMGRALARRRNISIIVHDPQPLVAAVGYGCAARSIVRFTNVSLIAHGADAALAVHQSVGSGVTLRVVAHPMLPPSEAPPAEETVVLVLGQYKPDRDLDALRDIAAASEPDWDLRILGRGWPEIPGWTVIARFVSEEEFATAIRESALVLIPYKRFYQSGVAYRALEAGRPVVGPRSSSLAEMITPDSPWLVSDDWPAGVKAAVSTSQRTVQDVAEALYARTHREWAMWCRDLRT